MNIKQKLLLLILSTTLIPLVIIIAMHRLSIIMIGDKVTSNIAARIDENAIFNMRDIIDDFEKSLHLNVQLLETILEIQANEVEKALAGPGRIIPLPAGAKFGLIEYISPPDKSVDVYASVNDKGQTVPFPVDFRNQRYLVTKKTNRKAVSRDLSRLTRLTAQYYRLYRMKADIIFWQHTSLESGLHTTYPAGGILPEDFHPENRDWYIRAKNRPGIVWSSPYIDASTQKPVITLSVSVRRPNGSFAGVTGIDIHLPDLFQWLKLNPDWADNAEGMLLVKGMTEQDRSIQILARMNFERASHQWDKPLELETLASQDKTEFEAFREDMLNGRAGVRIMRYKGEKAFWAYKGTSEMQVHPLLIVPYKNLTAFVSETEDLIWNKNLEWLRYSALIVFLVIITVIIVSIRRAESFTLPINKLAAAGKKLAGGNYGAHVNITTGDELQQLGTVFNDIGPQLQEREKMKHSLELARAVQQRLLPKEAPKSDAFDIAGYCKYCDETGGDYYDFISFDEIEPGKISVVLGDVTGHGIGAALLMASARSIFRNNVRHYAYDLSKILYELNNELAVDTDPDKFITLFYGLLDSNTKSITWTAGGHDPAILHHPENGQTEDLKSEGIPVGFMKNAQFTQTGPKKLKEGDIIVVGTDGIWEAENENEEMFGKERFLEIIRQNSTKPAQEICEKVVDSVIDYCHPVIPDDDITIIVIKVL